MSTITVDDLLNQALAGGGGVSNDSGQEVEIDLHEFVDDLGKTAEFLEKAAESLPHTPEFVAAQKKFLDNPMGFTRRDVHQANKKFISAVLPQSARSESVPESIDSIQKKASDNPIVESFLSRIRSRGI